MSQSKTTTKRITTADLDPQTQQLIKQAGQGKIRVIFEEEGEPVAVVMPVASAQQWEAEREEFFNTFTKVAQRANLPEDEADALALESVKAVRAVPAGS